MKKTVRISFEGKTYDVEVEVLDSAVAAAPAAPVAAAPAAAAPAAAPAAAGGTEVKCPLAGSVFKLKVKVGDKVITSKYSGTEVKIDGEELIIVRQGDILAVVD